MSSSSHGAARTECGRHRALVLEEPDTFSSVIVVAGRIRFVGWRTNQGGDCDDVAIRASGDYTGNAR